MKLFWTALMLIIGIAALSGSSLAYSSSYFANMSFDTGSSTGSVSVFNPITASVTSNCNATLNFRYSIKDTSGSNYNYLLTYLINGVINFTATTTGTSNQTCTFIATRDVLNGTFKNATVNMQSFATNVNITLEIDADLSCDSNDTFVFFDDSSNPLGSWGYQFYGPGFVSLIPYGSFPLLNTTYSSCESARPASNGPINLNSAGTANVTQFVYPYNSGNGSVFIEAFEPPSYTTGDMALICSNYNTATQTDTFLFNFHSGGIPGFNSSMYLQPFTEYLLHCEWGISNPGSIARDFFPLNFTLNITDISPNYVCNVTDCINQSRTITCHDTKNLFPDTVSTQSCLLQNETVYLGFEDSAPRVTTECVVGSACFFEAANITYLNPENPHWEILPNSIILFSPNQTQGSLYGGTMTGTETFRVNDTDIVVSPIQESWNIGSMFLKLWYEPPFFTHAFFEPNTTTFQCGNSTGGIQALSTFDYVNSTFLAALNFTFPSNTMSMFVDVRKCPSVPVQYTPPFYCLLSGGQKCYGECSVEPKGNYFIIVTDVTNASNVLTYNDVSVKENWTTVKIDVSNVINQFHNYRVILGVQPSNGWLFDSNPYCSYFDNLRLFNTQTSTLDDLAIQLFGKPYNQLTPQQQLTVNSQYCTPPSQCVGNDLYVNTKTNGVCVSKIYINEPNCLAQQQSQVISGSQSIFVPISSIADASIGNETLADSWKNAGFGFALIFLTPVFWIMTFIVVVMSVVAWKTTHMEIGVAAAILLLGAFSMALPELIIITIILIGIVAFIIGRTAVKAVAGGGS